MGRATEIDRAIGRQIRRLRERRNLRSVDVARLAGMPATSYSAIENGQHAVKVARLAPILTALDAEIVDVWPASTVRNLVVRPELRELAKHEARILDLVELFEADAAGLFVVSDRRACVLLTANLPEETALRVAFYLESHSPPTEAELYTCRRAESYYCLLLYGSRGSLPDSVIDFHLESWAEAFSSDRLLFKAAKNQHDQP